MNLATANPLIRKLEVVGSFTDKDRTTLSAVCTVIRQVAVGKDIVAQGDPPGDVHLVMSGMAYRYKLLSDGRRQIVALMLPGDFCDLHEAILGEMDHSIGTLTACAIVNIPAATIRQLMARHPRIAHALWWATLVDEGTLREWLVNLGQRESVERMAHLFCELLLRSQMVGMADANSYEMPLRQPQLADLLGLTSVHVNRTLRVLREAKLIRLEQRRLTILDVPRLMASCEFDPAYLHLRARLIDTQTEDGDFQAR